MTAVLAAAMLALGVVVGAAIGPAPSPSFAVGSLLPRLLPSLLATARSSAVQPPPVTAQATPSAEGARRRRKRHRKHLAASEASTATTETPASESTTPATTTPTNGAKTKPSTLAPVTKVWLIELANSTFGEAAANASSSPYIASTATPAGTLLSGWSALDASAFASDAALLAGSSPQLLDTIVQPPCPPASAPAAEGATSAPCTPATGPAALASADEFLKATLPTITSQAAYRENGLVVVTFASVASATDTGLPAGAATATLTSQPPAGALLISPFAKAGVKSTAAFDPSSPARSLEKLLHR